ncbi:MAG: hypothetical protein ACP5PW_02620 [Candidatus Dormibacteria bacterium]
MAAPAWRDQAAAGHLGQRVESLARDGGLLRADASLLASAAAIADEWRISVYAAAHVAAARHHGAQLVSCDVRDLVSRGLALLPGGAGGSRSPL